MCFTYGVGCTKPLDVGVVHLPALVKIPCLPVAVYSAWVRNRVSVGLTRDNSWILSTVDLIGGAQVKPLRPSP